MVTRPFRFCLLALFLLLSSPANGAQEDVQQSIDWLDNQIASLEDGEEKAKLCCYRARNYLKLKDIDQAEQNYLEALDYHYSGWILHEYGYFLHRIGEYERAYRAAQKVLDDFPQFEKSAAKLKKKAYADYQEEYNSANPPTIIMDTEVDPYRVSRHDLIRQLAPRQESRSAGGDARKASSTASAAKPQKSSKTRRS